MKRIEILLTGAGGLFGTRLAEAASRDCVLYRHYHHSPEAGAGPEVIVGDLVDPDHVKQLSVNIAPDIIVNTAALADVDRCETDPDLSRQVNVILVKNLIENFPQAKIVQISTDYVFSDEASRGDALPSPDDPPHPINVYGRHKLEAERLVSAGSAQHLIVRVNSLYDYRGRTNIFSHVFESLSAGKTIYGLTDQISNPIAARTAAHITIDLLSKNAGGIYHVGGRDIVSRYVFAAMIADYFGLDKRLILSSTSAARTRPARRPIRAGLDCRPTEMFLGAPMPAIREDFARLKREMDHA